MKVVVQAGTEKRITQNIVAEVMVPTVITERPSRGGFLGWGTKKMWTWVILHQITNV